MGGDTNFYFEQRSTKKSRLPLLEGTQADSPLPEEGAETSPFSTDWLNIANLSENTTLIGRMKSKPKKDESISRYEFPASFWEDNSYIVLDPTQVDSERMRRVTNFRPITQILQKSVITPDFEQKESAPPYLRGIRAMKRLRKAERAKTKGKRWFDLPAPEMTPQAETDLTIVKHRAALASPGHFYKENDRSVVPKYFQFGTVVDSAWDSGGDRLTRRERKSTIVDELLASEQFRRTNGKFRELRDARARKMRGRFSRRKK